MTLKEEVSFSLAFEDLQEAQSDQLLSYYFWMEDLDSDGNPAPHGRRHVLRGGPTF
jgi:hypothetical protein